jgi:hypothetical protein
VAGRVAEGSVAAVGPCDAAHVRARVAALVHRLGPRTLATPEAFVDDLGGGTLTS